MRLILIVLTLLAIQVSCAKAPDRPNYASAGGENRISEANSAVRSEDGILYLAERPIDQRFSVQCNSPFDPSNPVLETSIRCNLGIDGDISQTLDSDLVVTYSLKIARGSDMLFQSTLPKNANQKWHFGFDFLAGTRSLYDDLQSTTIQVTISSQSHAKILVYPVLSLMSLDI